MCNDSVLLTASNISTQVYYWQGPGISGTLNDSVVQANVSGTYTFTVVDSTGCSSFNYVEVNIATGPPTEVNPYMFNITNIIINDTVFVCEGDTVILHVFDSISDPNHLIIDNPLLGNNWDNSFWTVSPPVPYECVFLPHICLYPQTSGYYAITFSFTMGNSCGSYSYSKTDSVYIVVSPAPALNVTITGSSHFCPGSSALLVAHGASSYNWFYPLSIAGTTNDSIYVSMPSYYRVAGFDTNAYGCHSADTAWMYVTYWSPPVVYMSPNHGVICPSGYVTLTTTSGCLDYDWYGPNGLLAANSYSVQVNTAGYYFCIMTMPDSCVVTSITVEVKQYVTPFLVASPNDYLCYGDSTMVCLVTNAGSNYNWLPPLSGNSECQIISTQGTYYCQVSSCGIITMADVEIMVSDPDITITLSGPVLFCVGDSVILQTTAGMAVYDWTPGGIGGNYVVVYDSGDYSLVVTNEYGCEAYSDTITVEVLPDFTPVVAGDSISICAGYTATLSASGANNYNWVLDPYSTSPFETDSVWTTPVLDSSVTYYVYSYNAACSSEYIPVEVVVFTPVADIIPLGPVIFCEGDSLHIQANSGMETYEWFPGGVGADSLIVYDSGDYYLITTDALGCQANSDTISVVMYNIFTPVVSDDTICTGQTSTLSATGANNYNWVLDSISTTPFETDSVWSTQALYNSVTYYVYSSNPACNSDHIPVNIVVLDSLDAINPELYSNSPLCDIDTLILSSNADPSCDFYWSGPLGFSSNDPVPVITDLSSLNSGIYTLYVYANGCYSYQSSIPVTINSTPVILTSNDTLICINDQVELFASGGVSYIWSPPLFLNDYLISDPVSIPDSSISYTVTITDANNCTNTAAVSITVQNTPHITYNLDTTIIVGESVLFLISSNENILDFYWTPDYHISCTNCLNPVVDPLVSTEYIFEYSDSLGCSYPDIIINVEVLDEFTLDMPLAFTPNGDGVNDIVYVKGWGIKELLEYRIYDRWGQEIFSTDDINQGWDGTYKGKPQNIDTYAYYVKARFFNNIEKEKKGTISLLR